MTKTLPPQIRSCDSSNGKKSKINTRSFGKIVTPEKLIDTKYRLSRTNKNNRSCKPKLTTSMLAKRINVGLPTI